MGFPVQVKTGDTVHNITAEEGWSIPEFKKAIEAKTGIAASDQKLTVGGKVMKEAKNLADFPAAHKQPVNLISSGAPKAAAASSGGGEGEGKREQVDQLFSYIIKMVEENKQAQEFKEKYGKEIPDTTELQEALGIDGVESAKKKALDEMTKVLEGDWTPFDVYVGPFRTFAKKVLGEEIEEEKRQKWIEKAVSLALEKLVDYPEVQEQISKHTKPGTDLVQQLVPVAKVLMKRAMNLFLDGANPKYADHPKFSDQMRLLTVTSVGAVMDVCCECLEDGKAQCQELMAKLCGVIIEKLTEKMPEYTTLFTFAGPMAVMQMINWHEEFEKSVKGKTWDA